jgi:hypothetical protein
MPNRHALRPLDLKTLSRNQIADVRRRATTRFFETSILYAKRSTEFETHGVCVPLLGWSERRANAGATCATRCASLRPGLLQSAVYDAWCYEDVLVRSAGNGGVCGLPRAADGGHAEHRVSGSRSMSGRCWSPRFLGLTPPEDQQLAGLLMWVPVGVLYTAAGRWFAWRWLHATARRDRMSPQPPLRSPTVNFMARGCGPTLAD